MTSQADNKDLMPELKDLIGRIIAFNRLHPEGAFVYNFIGFKKVKDSQCDCCDGELDEVDENKSIGGAFGDIEDIRYLCNMIRDIAEDVKDEDGHVDI